ncbi:phospholipase-like protein [Tanacetum coccineum]
MPLQPSIHYRRYVETSIVVCGQEFFEVLVTSFEKQSSGAGGYRLKMTKVLEIFRKARLPVMMLDVHVEGLVDRLFKQFLTSANSNTSATLLEMEKIMTTIIEESGELALNLKAEYYLYSRQGGEGKGVDTVQTLTHCEQATTDRVNLQGHHTEDGKKKVLPFASGNYSSMAVGCSSVLRVLRKSAYSWTHEDAKKKVSSDDPPMPSKSVTEVTGKRNRNNEQQGVPRNVLYIMKHGYKVKKINAPILEAIFKKHGDIASDCVVKQLP